MTKNEWKEEKARRRAVLDAFTFGRTHALYEAEKLVAEHERLRQLASATAPDGHVSCEGYDDDESENSCDEIAPAVAGKIPEGWTYQRHTCGDDDESTLYCPRHAHLGEATSKCSDCSR